MSDGYSYIVELVDKISGPAKTAAGQINALTSKLEADDQALKKLVADMKKLEDQGPLSAQETKKFTSEIQKKQSAIDKGASSIRSAVAGEQKHALAAKQAAAAEELAASGGNSLNSSLVAMGPFAAAAAAALVAFGGGLVAATIAGAKLALSASDFKGDTLDALQAITGTQAAAQETFDNIRKIGESVQFSEADTVKLATDLLDTGIKNGAQLESTIKAVANLTQVRGEEAGGKLKSIIEKSITAGSFNLNAKQLTGTGVQLADVYANLAKRLGVSVVQVKAQMAAGKVAASDGIDALNEEINKKLGGLAEKQLLDIDVQAKKFHDVIAHLFEDVDPGPFLEAVRDTIKLFDTSTESGKALKWLATTIFTGLFAVSKQVFPYVKLAILETVIVLLKLYIAAKPIVAKLREIWSTGEQGEATRSLIKGVVDLVVGLAGALILVAGYWLIFASYGIKAWGAIFGALESFDIVALLGNVWSALASVFSAVSGATLATALIDGLVDGITGGASRVVAALENVGQSAISSVKETLGIASPSKVMQELGGHTAAGFAIGVEDGTASTQGAVEGAVAPPAAGGGGAGGGVQVTVEAGAIVIQGGGANAQELLELLTSQFTDKLEEILMQLGGAKGAT